jgi:hypothetical protein
MASWKDVTAQLLIAFGADNADPSPTFVDYFGKVLDEESGGQLNADRGRKSPLQQFNSGRFTAALDLRDRALEDQDPFGQVLFRMTKGAVTGDLFRGFIDRLTAVWDGPSTSRVTLTAYDALGLFDITDAPSSAFAVEVMADIVDIVDWYRLGEGVGPNMLDESGNGHDGTYTGTLAWTSGLALNDATQALDCSAGDVRGAIPSGGKITAVPYTLELSLVLPSLAGNQVAVIQEDDFAVFYSPNTTVDATHDQLDTGWLGLDDALGGAEQSMGAQVPPGPHHVVFTRTSSLLRMWVDGVEQSLTTRSQRLPAGATARNIGGPAADPTPPTPRAATQGSGTTITAPTNLAGDLIIVMGDIGSLGDGFTQLTANPIYYKISSGSEAATWTYGGGGACWVACSYAFVDSSDPFSYPVVAVGGTGTLTIPSVYVPARKTLMVGCSLDHNAGGVLPATGFTSRANSAGTVAFVSTAVNIADRVHPGGDTGAFTLTGVVASGALYIFFLNPSELGSPWDDIVDEVVLYDAVLPDARIAAHAAAWATAWEGDLTGERANRLLDSFGSSGWPTSLREIDAGNSIMSAAQLGGSYLDALRAVETAEQGRLFVAGDGTVILRSRMAPTVRSTEALVQAVYSR